MSTTTGQRARVDGSASLLFETGGHSVGGAGLLGLLAAQTLAATTVAALALTLPVWVSALLLTVVPTLAAAGSARAGRKRIAKAGTPAPERTIGAHRHTRSVRRPDRAHP
ncbi:phage holin family protein [Streptomyces sp. NPDC096097]|uniref:phage holin family protein n=1 Tax=Streptomyces sp. NPDC096097 TaxID=3155546 RepID=UPI00332F6B83